MWRIGDSQPDPLLSSCFLPVYCQGAEINFQTQSTRTCHNNTFIPTVAEKYTSQSRLSPLTLIPAANISIIIIIIISDNNKSKNKKHTIYINFKHCISSVNNMRSNYILMLYKDAVKTWKKWFTLNDCRRRSIMKRKSSKKNHNQLSVHEIVSMNIIHVVL